MAGSEDDYNGNINGRENILEHDVTHEPLLKKQIMESDLVAVDALKEAGASLDAAYAIRDAVEGLSSYNGNGKLWHALRVKRLAPNAILPCRGSASAAGYDLSSAYEAVVPARGKALVKTELSIAIPEGHYARIAPRSGLAWKNAIDVGAGVIDYDYRGPLGVILFNHSDIDFYIKHGDRIAQLVLEKISTPEVIEVNDLDSTARGIGGFGSTGVSLESNSTVTVTVEETVVQ